MCLENIVGLDPLKLNLDPPVVQIGKFGDTIWHNNCVYICESKRKQFWLLEVVVAEEGESEEEESVGLESLKRTTITTIIAIAIPIKITTRIIQIFDFFFFFVLHAQNNNIKGKLN